MWMRSGSPLLMYLPNLALWQTRQFSPPWPHPWKWAKFKTHPGRIETITSKSCISFSESLYTTMTRIAGVRQRDDKRMSRKMCKEIVENCCSLVFELIAPLGKISLNPFPLTRSDLLFYNTTSFYTFTS